MRAERAASFARVADAYERARPGYPADAVLWLAGETPCDVVDLGAGTGKLTRSLAALGHHIVAVEPSESAVLSGGASGVHKIEGIGAGFVVPLWRPDVADEVATVSTEEAMAMARRLAHADALFAGTSTGANLVAAIAVGRRLGRGATVVTVMCDTGIKYVSTALYDLGPAVPPA